MADLYGTDNPERTKICTICGAIYEKSRTVSRKVWSASRFCSKRCINVGRAPGNKGKKTGKPSWNTGRECPETSGERNGAWKGGVDRKTCRRLAMKRDDFTCQSCGLREPEIMQADHIKPESLFPELARDVGNMVTLCPNCHARKTVAELKAGISHAGRRLVAGVVAA